MTFEDILLKVPNFKYVGYNVLKEWSYSFEEAVQESLITLWEISKMKTPVHNIYGLLKTKLTNKQIDGWRKNGAQRGYQHISMDSRDKQNDFGEARPQQVKAPDPLISAEEFLKLLNSLPLDRKELLFFRYYMGYSQRELSERFALSEGTVKSRISRSCEKLSHTPHLLT